MSRFYVPKEFITGKETVITGKEAHHILDVMRLKESDGVVFFDGTGKEYDGIIKEAQAGRVLIEIKKERRPRLSSYTVTLIQSIPKKDKMDYVVEKATELGVGRIIPVVSERTIPRWKDAKKEALKERWRKIAVEASKQCGRSDIPVIDDIVEFADCIAKIGTCPLRLIAALSDEAIPLKDTLRDFKGDGIAVAIGPEGDFTPEEIEVAKSGGFKLISLGPRVLKSDTAGLSVLAAINYEYSD